MEENKNAGSGLEHRDFFEEFQLYFNRIFSGVYKTQNLLIPSYFVIFQAFVGSFVGILVLSYIDYKFILEDSDFIMIVGSFGAQAVLIFATPNVPLAQPWNCIIGNGVGSFIGVSCYKIFYNTVEHIEDWIWVASAAAVSLSIVVMLLTKSLHPPAGATALIAVQGSQRVHDLGYYYVLFPGLVASTIHVVIGIILNNLSKENIRAYPVVMLPYQFNNINITSLFTYFSAKNLDNPEESTTYKEENNHRYQQQQQEEHQHQEYQEEQYHHHHHSQNENHLENHDHSEDIAIEMNHV